MEYLSHEVRKKGMISRQAFHSGCCNVVLTDGSVKGRGWSISTLQWMIFKSAGFFVLYSEVWPTRSSSPFFRDMLQRLVCTPTLTPTKTKECWLSLIFLHSHVTSATMNKKADGRFTVDDSELFGTAKSCRDNIRLYTHLESPCQLKWLQFRAKSNVGNN